jgi:heme A synthase
MLKILAPASVVGVFLLLVVGGIVSATGSGLGCPDWPLCHGQLIPDFNNREVFIEWSHRLVASLVGLLVLATAIVAWREKMRLVAGLSLFLLLAQARLGGLTVKLELTSPEVTTAHLALGFALFAVLVIINALANRGSLANQKTSEVIFKLALTTMLIVYVQILIGGYVRHTTAGLACLDFPFCNLQAYPPGVGLQLVHRLVGVLAAVLIGWTAMKISRAKLPRSLILLAHGAFGLVLVQIGLGAWSVWSKLAVHVTTTHLGVAAAIFGLLVALCVKLSYASASSSVAPRDSQRAGV